MPSADGPLACPRCGRTYDEDERLCPGCRMPLVVAGGEERAQGPGHEEARKIHPRYAHGELVRVAVGRNLAEAELIKGVLLEQGIPSMLRRTGGFDVPDFLAAGPRDVLVPSAGVDAARELLGEIEAESGGGAVGEAAIGESGAGETAAGPRSSVPLGFRVAAAVLVAILLIAALLGKVAIP